MKNLLLLILLILAWGSVADAAKIGSDVLTIGKTGSAADKQIDFGPTRFIKSDETGGTLCFSDDGIGCQSFSGLAGGAFNGTIGATGTYGNLSVANASATAGDALFVNTETVSGSVVFNKQLSIDGGKFGSKTTGTITIASGSDGMSIQNIRIDGNVFIDPGVKNVRVTDCWLPAGQSSQDNSGNQSNLIDCLEEE